MTAGRWRPGFVLALVAGAALLALAVAPGAFAPYEPYRADPGAALTGPDAAHWFGTDQLGRDVLARVVYGARTSLAMGFGATGLALLAGTLVGLAAALNGGIVREGLMRAMDVLLSCPGLLLALVAVALIGPGTLGATLAVAVAATPEYARLVNAQVRQVRTSGHVEAGVALGLRPRALVVRHVLPNALGPVLVLATLGVGTAILYGAALSFLGLGPNPPAAEWGALLSDGRDHLESAWWVAFFPGLAITLSVIVVNVVGRELRGRHLR
ncbi:ABC transporter permease [Actinomadura kijaniata]|uniref:ABC transporter permease n=1 Tax=Actinomadura kijaniata TaxID=46161 RepID=UPI003F194794